MSWQGSAYRYRLDRRWAELDPRLLWRPVDDIVAVLKCISHRRPVRQREAERITRRMAEARCSYPGAGSVRRSIMDYWWPLDFMWRGRVIHVRRVDWADLEREARADKRQFCLMELHRNEEWRRLNNRERELDEVRYLTNKLKKAITDERRKTGTGRFKRAGAVGARHP